MTADPATPTELSFGAAYDRLQAVAAELSADATMAPDRLIALLREGKGLERALRDHLERVEQDVRAIEDGDGAETFRIVAAPAPARPAPAAPAAPTGDAPAPAPPAGSGTPGPVPVRPAASRDPEPDDPFAPSAPAPRPASTPRPATPDAPPTLGFPGADDDIPF